MGFDNISGAAFRETGVTKGWYINSINGEEVRYKRPADFQQFRYKKHSAEGYNVRFFKASLKPSTAKRLSGLKRFGNYSNNNKLQLNGNYSNDNYSLSESEQSKINRFLMRQNQTVNFEDN